MEKLKYRLQEGEEIIRVGDNESLRTFEELDKDYLIKIAVVIRKPITEKKLVEKVKKTNKKNK